jgi:hypothetical protein
MAPHRSGELALRLLSDLYAELISTIADKVYANFAGHLHVDYDEEFPEEGYSTFVTDATWDDAINLRRVSVFGDGQRMTYEQHLVVVEPCGRLGSRAGPWGLHIRLDCTEI